MRQAEWEELILSLTMTPVDLKEIYHGGEEYANVRYVRAWMERRSCS